VLRVTTLADEGAGSLRAAVEAEGARTIIFDVGGEIVLQRPLNVRAGCVTVAGQTAPGGGVTLRGQPLVIDADDVVVRYLRIRLGDETGVESDAVSVTGGRRVILDHLSASWSVDETLSVAARSQSADDGPRDVTVQWSIISESLNRSGHAKGAHGYGSLIRMGFGARASFHHNLWAHHSARMPRPGNYNGVDVDPEGPILEFRSNVFYNWAGSRSGYNADTAQAITYAFIDNAYLPGPNSTGRYAFDEKNQSARAWFAGNTMAGATPADPWSLISGAMPADYRLSAAPDIAPVEAEDAASAQVSVLTAAGASRFRDAVDARVVETVRTGGGRLIDSQADVGGWPVLERGRPWIDGDGDGLPDDWETRQGLDPADASDAARVAGAEGWTHLELWLAELAAPAEGQ